MNEIKGNRMKKIETNAEYFPLGAVEVTDAFCKNALKKEVEYLLSLQTGRLLAGFYENAGLPTPFLRYGGWESGLMGGHTLGHYLTALAQAYANAGVGREEKARLFAAIGRILDGLAECQKNTKGKRGFLWGAPLIPGGAEAQFDNVERGRTNIVREAWVPWYTMHKLLAGLIEAHRLTKSPLALEIAVGLGDWVCDRVSKCRKSTLKRVLCVEYGGMNDALYELWSLTGEEKYAESAHLFDEEPLFDRILSGRKDSLKDLHANTTIPKVLGALNRYLTLHGRELCGERVDATRYLHVAEMFFETVVGRHAYVTGGFSEWEHFGADGVLDAERTNCNCETCNVYNMLKLSRLLFCVTGDKKYADYYDNAFTNSILASQNPETGMSTYFQPMASGFFKVFSTPENSFWCCTGSGMENFTKLGDSAYYRRGKILFVEQYLSSVLRTEKYEIVQSANFPFDSVARFHVSRAKEPFFVRFRIPDWAAGEITAKKNGEKVVVCESGGHILLAVKENDEIELRIPVEVTLKGLPDGKDAFAFCYGGTVLCADLGTEDMEETETGVSVTIPARKKLATDRIYFKDLYDVFETPSRYLVREGEKFKLTGGDVSLTFEPYFRRFRGRYAIYLSLSEGERGPETETRTPYDTVQAGYGQYEADALHEMEENNSVGETADGTCRYARAGGYFSYDVAVDPQKRNVLSLELCRADNGRMLKIFAEGELLLSERLLYTQGEERYRREIELPPAVLARARKKKIRGKEYFVVRIRFEGERGKRSARIAEFLYLYAE